jgi:hypothetical protein
MESDKENSGTKLPEIKNASSRESDGLEGTRNEVLQNNTHSNGMHTGRGRRYHNYLTTSVSVKI